MCLDMYLRSERKKNALYCSLITEKNILVHHEFLITISLEVCPFLLVI